MPSSLPRTSGIYQITCTNGRIYIGSSIDIEKRWQAHLAALQRGDHTNRHLQSAWNKYGEGCFFWEVLETCEETLLESLEQFYLETRNPYQKRGFNISLDTKSVMRGRKHTPESIAKMSAHQNKTISQAARYGSSVYHKGRPKSAEHRAKIGTAQKGKIIPLEQREKIRKSTVITPEQRAYIAQVQAKRYIVTTPEGIEIEVINLQKFCRENGLHQSAMCGIANGRRPHYKKWLCRHA